MSGFTTLTTRPKGQHKATADLAAGAIVLAMLLIVAQVMFATQHPATLAAALLHAPFGIVAP
jgi:hypothetical protein